MWGWPIRFGRGQISTQRLPSLAPHVSMCEMCTLSIRKRSTTSQKTHFLILRVRSVVDLDPRQTGAKQGAGATPVNRSVQKKRFAAQNSAV